MIVLSEKDYLEVKFASLIGDYDRDTLVNLYQPLIGYEATASYLTLWSEANNQRLSPMISHGQLLRHMRITVNKFIDARKSLEATGLLKTYITKCGDFNIYRYELYAPKDPWNFFGNALLFGLLIQAIGESEANRMKSLYKLDINEDKGEDISSSFMEVFHPDFEDPAFMRALSNDGAVKGRVVAKITSEFSYEKFFEELAKVSQITESSFSKKDMKEIERLATLNGINEETAANDVANIYDVTAGKGHHIDFQELAKMFQNETNYNYLMSKKRSNKPNFVSGTSDLSEKINLMEMSTPKDYLSILQGGSMPASADLKIIEFLSKNFQLNNGVINAIIDFVLTSNNNVLSRAYAEKVAASVARSNIETTVDAMNYFRNSFKKKTTPSASTVKYEPQTEEVENDNSINSASNDDVDWDKLLSDLEEAGKNGEN